MSKISKASALYTYHPDVPDYVCSDCLFEKDVNGKDYCALFGPAAPISGDHGSCNEYLHGEPEKQEIDVPWLSIATREQLGYMENSPGFGCRRCVHFGVGKNDCEVVDKDSPGDTPGEINPFACCNAWSRDLKRGGMSDEQLVQVLVRKPATNPSVSAQKKNS